jgi:uncharacterized Zn finger protein
MFEDLMDKKSKIWGPEVEECPQCSSSDIEMYPVVASDTSFYYIRCNDCGFRWTTSDV